VILEIVITNIKDFIKSRSRLRTLFKILLALIVLNILYRICSSNEVKRRVAPTIKNISEATELKYKTVWLYIKLLKKQGIVKESYWMERAGRVYVLERICIGNVAIDVPMVLNVLPELAEKLGRLIEENPKLKQMVLKFWYKALKIVYDVVDNTYRSFNRLKGKGKYIIRKLKLNDILHRIKRHIDSIENGELDYIHLAKDVDYLLVKLQQLRTAKVG